MNLESEKLLTAKDLARICQLSPRTVIEKSQKGELPDPIIDGYRSKRWHPDAIRKWLATGKTR